MRKFLNVSFGSIAAALLLLLLTTCNITDLPMRSDILDLAFNYVWTPTAAVQADSPSASDYFGYSVAMDGDWAAVGDYVYSSGAGKVYILRRSGNGWTVVDRLTHTSATNLFGKALAMSPEFLFVGSPLENPDNPDSPDDRGVVHVYRLQSGSWAYDTKIGGVDAGAQFGSAIAMGSDFAIIGAPVYSTSTGIAYAVPRSSGGGTDNWNMGARQTIWQKAADREDYDYFGSSITMTDTCAVVGAYGDDGSAGAAFVFLRSGDTWGASDFRENQKLVEDSSTAGHEFGRSVAITAGCLIVGAPGSDSAYTFSFSGTRWERDLPRLYASDGAADDDYGFSVATATVTDPSKRPIVIVGAPAASYGGASAAGKVYFYEKVFGSWSEVGNVSADGRIDARFGNALAAGSSHVIVGAYGEPNLSGAAYLFSRARD